MLSSKYQIRMNNNNVNKHELTNMTFTNKHLNANTDAGNDK